MGKDIFTKSKIFFNLLVKRGRLASEAIGKTLEQHEYYATLTCRSDDVCRSSIISSGDYEFSCSNSPAYPSLHHIMKPKSRRNRSYPMKYNIPYQIEQIRSINYGVKEASRLPGLGKARGLRVTDSPFSEKDMGGDPHKVDEDAEEFIRRFYKDLRNQRRVFALESPSPRHIYGR